MTKEIIDNDTMENYTIYCTECQTKAAIKLGAPIQNYPMYMYDKDNLPKFIHKNEWNREGFSYHPTAEQMCGWLEAQDCIIQINVCQYVGGGWFYSICNHTEYVKIDGKPQYYIGRFRSRQDATLGAISAALDYLIYNKK